MKNKYDIFLFSILTLLLLTCGTDDGNSVLEIVTNSDTVVIEQNSQIEIFIFQNDSNIPNSGQLTITSPSKGNAQINNNATPSDLSDDSIIFSTIANLVGEDSFQ